MSTDTENTTSLYETLKIEDKKTEEKVKYPSRGDIVKLEGYDFYFIVKRYDIKKVILKPINLQKEKNEN